MKTITVQKRGEGYIYDLFSEKTAIKRGVRCGLTPIDAATSITKLLMLNQNEGVALVAPSEVLELIPAHLLDLGRNEVELKDKGMIPNPEIGYTPNNLKAVRMAYRLTQLDVANIVDTSQRMVMRWETDIKQTSAHSDMPHTKWVRLLDVLRQKNEQ